MCHPYLDNETSYYLGDTEWIDDPNSFLGSLMTKVVDAFGHVLNPGFLLKYTALIVICHAFFYLFFASLPIASHDVACLANIKEQFCHSAYKECAEVGGTFVPTLMWFVQVHFFWTLSGLFVHLLKKAHASCRVFLFLLWEHFSAPESVKIERPFGTFVLQRSSKIRFNRKTLIHKCLLW